METINNNPLRNGNFTSSEIVALLSMGSREMTERELENHKKDNPKSKKRNIESWPGAAAITYIEECNMERRLLRSITDESNARPLSWGTLTERKAFATLGTEYSLNSQETTVHPTISYWSGSADGFKYDEGKTVVDIKCPVSLKSFCTLVDCIVMVEVDGVWVQDGAQSIANVRERHKEGEKYYQQLVSNAILNDCKYAELIVYMPYLEELDSIRELASNWDGVDQHKFMWIGLAQDCELPHLLLNGYYKNINVIRFEVPETDKKLLTERVLMAGTKLNQFFKPEK